MGAGSSAPDVSAGDFDLTQLNDLDIVLIRSRVQLTSIGLDYQVAKGIEAAVRQAAVEPEVSIHAWDRVGLLAVPEWKDEADKQAFTTKSIMVTEATAECVRTSSLEEVCNGALAVAVRPLRIVGHSGDPRARRRRSVALGAEEAIRIRAELQAKWYRLMSQVINRQYGTSPAALKPMLDAVAADLAGYAMSDEEEQAVSEIYDLHDSDGKGLTVEGIVDVCAALSKHEWLLNPFSHNDVVDLVSSTDDAAHRGRCSKADFLRVYRSSMRRTEESRRRPREIVSGAFVSLALQAMGLLQEDSHNFFLPVEFSSSLPANSARRSYEAVDKFLTMAELGPERPVVRRLS
jgi:hypothetical protein